MLRTRLTICDDVLLLILAYTVNILLKYWGSYRNRPVVSWGSDIPEDRKVDHCGRESCFKPAQGVLTCSGVNVAVLTNERVSMRGVKADAPRDGIVVGSHHQYQQQLEPRVRSRHCSRARAHGTTNPNQYHIFATLPTSVQFPLPFLGLRLFTDTHNVATPNASAQAVIFTNSTHGRSGQQLQLVFEKCRVQIPAG